MDTGKSEYRYLMVSAVVLVWLLPLMVIRVWGPEISAVWWIVLGTTVYATSLVARRLVSTRLRAAVLDRQTEFELGVGTVGSLVLTGLMPREPYGLLVMLAIGIAVGAANATLLPRIAGPAARGGD